MNDLKNSNICLFKLFEFSCFAHVEITTDLLVWSNPNQSNGGYLYSDPTSKGWFTLLCNSAATCNRQVFCE